MRHLDEWFGHEVDLDVVLHDPAFVVGVVEAAGLVDLEWYLPPPGGAPPPPPPPAVAGRAEGPGGQARPPPPDRKLAEAMTQGVAAGETCLLATPTSASSSTTT